MNNKLTQRAQRAIETKQRIYESALRLFRERDLEDVTISEICKGANVSCGHFYNYFDSKEALLLLCYPAFDDFVRDEFSQRAFENVTAEIKAIVYEQTLVVANLGLGLFAQIMKLQLRLHGQYVVESNRYYHTHMRQLVRAAVQNGEFRSDLDPDDVSDMIFRLVRGVFYDWGVRSGAYDLAERVQADLQILLDGLAARPDQTKGTHI
jgi:AcrR family transcriptional regulator